MSKKSFIIVWQQGSWRLFDNEDRYSDKDVSDRFACKHMDKAQRHGLLPDRIDVDFRMIVQKDRCGLRTRYSFLRMR